MRKYAKTIYWHGMRRTCSYLRFIVYPWRFDSYEESWYIYETKLLLQEVSKCWKHILRTFWILTPDS